MIELAHRLQEPVELKRYRADSPGGSWEAGDFRPVRTIVRRQLNLEQEGLCVYCEQELGEDQGHVEHIRPKGVTPALTFVYANLAHSCQGPGHCGHHRKCQEFIEPRPGCNRFFDAMSLDGRIVASVELSLDQKERADITVRILGLNSPSLSRQRKQYADVLRYLSAVERKVFIARIPFRWVLARLSMTA